MVDVTRTYIAADVGYCPTCAGNDVLITYQDNETKELYQECQGCEERTPIERKAPIHAP